MVYSWDECPVIMDLVFVSRILGQTPETLKKRAQRSELPGAFKTGREWRVSKDKLRAYIEGQRN